MNVNMFLLNINSSSLFLNLGLLVCIYFIFTFVFFFNNSLESNLNIDKNVGSTFIIINHKLNLVIKYLLALILFISLLAYTYLFPFDVTFDLIIRNFLLLFFFNFYVNYFVLGEFLFFKSNNNSNNAINFVLFILILLQILLCKPTWFITCLVLETLTFLLLSVFLFFNHKSKNFVLFYILLSTSATILLISSIFFYFFDIQTISNVLIIMFFCLKAGVLPLGFWVYYFYQNMNLDCFFIYTTFFYLNLIVCALILVLLMVNSLYVSSLLKIFITILTMLLLFVFDYRSGTIQNIFIISTWSTSLLLLILVI